MLEVRHLTKIYKTKGGADVKALDDVSVRFKETGLVFLLGKSGSGKSTFLNLAGGLDEPTDGEVIVMGKSSKEFSGSDFDSYRNTFVGFVFQEYNVLNEFNVEDNVALALELQGKTREKERVKAILEEVELTHFAKRKPNTLSGGQKQRIAIARALVKDPRIIMADEPTGALDSVTGKQVFDTLKRLSKTRLVLVVSHDRDFAEEYGDRIIELKDGKILSDVSKTKESPETHGVLTRIDSDTISLRGEPDEAALKEINAFLRESGGEVLLTRGEKEIKSFKRVNRIDENGARERFEDTDETAIPESGSSDAQFIRSRLPVRKAVKIGASGLKLKPFRLVLTILLSCVSFIMFGLFSTMMFFNERSALIESFFASDYEYLTLEKRYTAREYYQYYQDGKLYEEMSGVSVGSANLTPAEVKNFDEEAIGVIFFNAEPSYIKIESSHTNYYIPRLELATALPEGHGLRQKIVAGNYPAADDEICVSDYFLECLKHATFFTSDEKGGMLEQKQIGSAADLVGERLAINGRSFKVSGVFEAGKIPAKYDELDREQGDNFENYNLKYEFQSFLGEGLHSLVFVTDSTLESLALHNDHDDHQFFISARNGIRAKHAEAAEDTAHRLKAFRVYGTDPRQLPVYFFGDRTDLTGNELVLPFSTVAELMERGLRQLVGEDWQSSEDGERLWAAINTILTLTYAGSDGSYVPTEEELAAHETIQEIYAAYPFSVVFFDAESGLPIEDAVLAGYYTGSGRNNDGVYCSQEFFDSYVIIEANFREETNYVPEPDAIFQELLMPFERDRNAFSALLDKLDVTDPATDVSYSLSNRLCSEVASLSQTVEVLSTVFLVAGVVLACFAALLLFNFISVSISNKKKEIGILRAVGARGTDVFKIFFAESGIIVGICTLLALVGSIVLTVVLNNILRTELGLNAVLFVFGVPSILLMLAIAVFVALIATFLPVYFAARKKPVESIRAL